MIQVSSNLCSVRQPVSPHELVTIRNLEYRASLGPQQIWIAPDRNRLFGARHQLRQEITDLPRGRPANIINLTRPALERGNPILYARMASRTSMMV